MVDIYEAKQKRNELLVRIDRMENELMEARRAANELGEAIMEAEKQLNKSKYVKSKLY